MEGLWWENVHKAASGLRNAIQLIQLIFDHKPVCTSLCVPQIHLGDREGTVNILRYEPVCSGPSNILHRGHSAVTARRCRWVLPLSKVNPSIYWISCSLLLLWRDFVDIQTEQGLDANSETCSVSLTLLSFYSDAEGLEGEKSSSQNQSSLPGHRNQPRVSPTPTY